LPLVNCARGASSRICEDGSLARQKPLSNFRRFPPSVPILPRAFELRSQELSKAGVHVPIVLISAYADVAMAVRAMKAGAVDFLTKPFRSQDLLDAIFAAVERDSVRRKMRQWQSTLREHYESLTTRERQVIRRVTAGNLNKQIAADVGLSEVTVKLHRANAMRKMHATSLAHLIKMLEQLKQSVDLLIPSLCLLVGAA